MAEETIALAPASGQLGAQAPRWTAARPALPTAIGVLVLSTLIVLVTDTRPGFDPYGWLVWGHQTLTATLDTNAAPSWKPLPYLFTVPFGLFGHYQLWLWLVASVAISLSGVIFAGRIAWRLSAAPAERRWAGWVAAAFAGASLLAINQYWHYILSAQSDPMIVALTLAAIDSHLGGRRRWAFWCGWLASLGRPEAWPFLALYSVWLWRSDSSTRTMVIAGAVLLLVLWFGIPAITSRTPFVASANAHDSGRALRSGQIVGTLKRFLWLTPTPLKLAALLGTGWALARRDRTVLVLAAGVIVWMIVEIGFSLHGFPGVSRYMFEAAGVMIVVAGVAVGRLLSLPPSAPAGWARAALVLVLIAGLVPTAIHHAGTEHSDLNAQRRRTVELNALIAVIDRLGGPDRVRACGEPLTRLQYQSALAWNLHRNVSSVGFKYGRAIRSGRPIVLFTPYATHVGWVVRALHQHSAAGCAGSSGGHR